VTAGSGVEVRSFRAVFALERRVYQFDTVRLNPSGVPLRGIVYAVILVSASLIVSASPITGWLVSAIPWYLRDVALPLGVSGLLTMVRIEGRPFHIAAEALIRYRLESHRLVGLDPRPLSTRVWRPAPITWIVDGSEAVPRSMRYRGPGVSVVCFAHDRAELVSTRQRWRRVHLSIHPINGPVRSAWAALELAPGAILEISPRPLREPKSGRS